MLLLSKFEKALERAINDIGTIQTHNETTPGTSPPDVTGLYTIIKNDDSHNVVAKRVHDGVTFFHSVDGQPARQHEGTKEWYKFGVHHRTDGPAIEHSNGSKLWYREGLLHCEDGPAYISQYVEAYAKNGLISSSSGPAMSYSDGVKVWALNEKIDKIEIGDAYCYVFDNKIAEIVYGSNRFHYRDGKLVFHTDGVMDTAWSGEGYRKYNHMTNILHCETGPAVYIPGTTTQFWQHNLLHCTEGPAYSHCSGLQIWANSGTIQKVELPSTKGTLTFEPILGSLVTNRSYTLPEIEPECVRILSAEFPDIWNNIAGGAKVLKEEIRIDEKCKIKHSVGSFISGQLVKNTSFDGGTIRIKSDEQVTIDGASFTNCYIHIDAPSVKMLNTKAHTCNIQTSGILYDMLNNNFEDVMWSKPKLDPLEEIKKEEESRELKLNNQSIDIEKLKDMIAHALQQSTTNYVGYMELPMKVTLIPEESYHIEEKPAPVEVETEPETDTDSSWAPALGAAGILALASLFSSKKKVKEKQSATF